MNNYAGFLHGKHGKGKRQHEEAQGWLSWRAGYLIECKAKFEEDETKVPNVLTHSFQT